MFLPFVLTLYYITPRRFRNLTLFIVDLVFYAWGEPWLVILMLFSILLNYTSGILIGINREKKGLARFIFILSVILNLGLLGFFKYAGFIGETLNMVMPFLNIPILEIALPIGISFYTFQTMSYTIDVYKNTVKVQKNIITFGTYVSLFPQLIAGPIVRYEDVAEQLMHRKETLQGFTDGVKLFLSWNFILWGLYFGVLLMIEKLFMLKVLKKAPAIISHIYSIIIILFGWVLFYFENLNEMGIFLARMFGSDGFMMSGDISVKIISYIPLLIVSAITSTPLISKLYHKIKSKPILYVIDNAGCVLALLLCTAALVSSDYNPFLYYKF